MLFLLFYCLCFDCIDYTRGAQPFRYCRSHYVYLYELPPTVSSKYIVCIASVLLPHTEPSQLPHVCLAVFPLSILIQQKRSI